MPIDDPEKAEAERYDADYAEFSSVFGESPDTLLTRFAGLIDPNRPILDVGAGQGRHSLYLAEQGFVVDAIDPSKVGIEQTRERARQRGLVVHACVAGWDAFDGRTASYGAVLLFGVVQLMARDRIKNLGDRAFHWLAPGGLLFVTGHTTDDAGHAERENDPAWLRLEPGTFVGPSGQVRTFLHPGEIVGLFPGFDVVHHDETVGPEHRHGNGAIERHAITQAVFRKRGS